MECSLPGSSVRRIPRQEYLSGLPFDECSILSLCWSFYYYIMSLFWGFPDGSDSKESACNEGPGFDPWVGKTPWNGPWQPTPVFSSGESKDSLEDYSPWGRNTLDTTEWLSTHCPFLSFFINFVLSLFCLTEYCDSHFLVISVAMDYLFPIPSLSI